MIEITQLQELLNSSKGLNKFPQPLEKNFQLNYANQITYTLKLTFFLGLLIYSLSCFFDFYFFKNLGTFSIRVFTILILIFLFFLLQLEIFKRLQQLIAIIFGIVLMVSLTYIASLIPAYTKDLLYQSLGVTILGIATLGRLQFWYIFVLMFSMLIIFNVGIFYSGIVNPIQLQWSFLGNNYILFAVGVLSLITGYMRNISVRKQFLYEFILKKENEFIKTQNLQDALTHVGNRRFYDEVLNTEWKNALTYQYPITIIFIDLDYFKQFNDLYGHSAGDKALMSVADAITKSVKRVGEFVARYGGDEFAIISPNSRIEDAINLSKYIQKNLKEMAIKHEGSKVSNYLSVTFGIATIIPTSNITPVALLNNADYALEYGKQKCRNNIYLYDEQKPKGEIVYSV